MKATKIKGPETEFRSAENTELCSMHAASCNTVDGFMDRWRNREHNLCELRPGVTWFVEQAMIQTEGGKRGNTWNGLVQSHELNI